MIREAIGHK